MRVMVGLLLALSLGRALAAVQMGPVSAEVTIDPQAPRLGDALLVVLEVRARPDVEVLMPAFGEFLGSFTIMDFVPDTAVGADGQQVLTQRFTLQLVRSGEHRIPAMLVEFVDRRPGQQATPPGEDSYELLTDPVAFEVQAVAIDAGETPVPPLQHLPERALPVRQQLLYFGTPLALLLAAALAGWWWWRRQRPQAGPSPSAQALARLQAVASLPHATPAEMDAYFVALSAVVRRYMEEGFGVHAPELTTEEFLIAVRDASELNAAERGFAGSFLSEADRVKFARARPGEDAALAALHNVRAFIKRTATGPAPAEDAAHA